MRAGQTLMMIMPGDSTPTAVPRQYAAEMRKRGAQWYGPNNAVPAPTKDEVNRLTQQNALGALAPTGAIVGSLVGGAVGGSAGALGGPAAPASIPGGAFAGRQIGGVVGGTAGKLIEEGASRAMGLGDAPGTVLGEAGTQAVMGPVGEAIGLPLQMVGRGIIRSGLPARMQDAGKAVKEMVKERLPVGGVNFGPLKSGGSRAAANLARKTAARDAANLAAGQSGVEISSRPIEQKMLQMADDYGLRGDRSAQLNALARRMDDFVETWKAGKLVPKDAQVYLSSLDEEARNIWKAEKKMGQHVPEAERRAAQQARQIAEVLRKEMRTLVPNHRSTSEGVSRAIAAKSAIDEAEHSGVLSLGSRLATGAALGAGVEHYMDPNRDPAGYATKMATGLLLAHPALSSRLGLSLAGGGLSTAATQAPRMVRDPEPILRLLQMLQQRPDTTGAQ